MVGEQMSVKSCCEVLRLDPNTNLMRTRTLLPIVRHQIDLQGEAKGIVILVSAVFGAKGGTGLEKDGLFGEFWRQRGFLEIVRNLV